MPRSVWNVIVPGFLALMGLWWLVTSVFFHKALFTDRRAVQTARWLGGMGTRTMYAVTGVILLAIAARLVAQA
jgi:hypothetical protein